MTPPALKWLLNERAAMKGALLHAQKTVGLLQKRIQVLQGNPLSDLMFVLARVLNRMNGGDDVYWKSERMATQGEG